jgi:hypothetical protein
LSIKKYIKNSIGFDKLWTQLNQKIDSQKILSGKLLAIENNKKDIIKSFEEIEFSVFSQVGDDGIIQWLINKIPFPEHAKSFIEFGVENYTEATTRFLLVNNNWRGLVMDGSTKNVEFIKNDSISWLHGLDSVQKFVTVENINKTIEDAGYKGEIGILHIDIDGNDYWVWNAITIINPKVVIIETHVEFGFNDIVVPYDANYFYPGKHPVYHGASPTAMQKLGKKKGYRLVGSNEMGYNFIFIKNGIAEDLIPEVSVESLISHPSAIESFKDFEPIKDWKYIRK